MLPLISALFTALQAWFGYLNSGAIVAVICIGIALITSYSIEETFGKELNYLEEI
jgi:hypothetical protein